MTDRIEVEVYQPPTNARPHRRDEKGVEVWGATLAPSSLAAAQIRLAEAVDKLHLVGAALADADPATIEDRYDVALADYRRKLAAVRSHPDYQEGTDAHS